MTPGDGEITDDQARDVLGLDSNMWTIQLDDEQLRMLQEIMAAEKKRRAEVFGGLFDKIAEIG